MRLDHLERLHDTIEPPDTEDTLHFWWIYAAADGDYNGRPPSDAPFIPFHASNEGIACVDDVARIAVAYLNHHDCRDDAHSRKRARQALEYVLYMQHSDGTFLNFITDPEMNETVFGDPSPDVVDGIKVDGSMTSIPALEFWSSRACWALGQGYETFSGDDAEFCNDLEDAIHRFLDALEAGPLDSYGEYETQRGKKIPSWLPNNDTYGTAPAVLGLASYYRASGDGRTKRLLEQLADGIFECRSGDTVSPPFSTHLGSPPGTPWHTWGLRQSASLARAGDVLDKREYVESARREVSALHTLHLSSEAQIASFGPAPLVYHQLSYGTDALVHCCTELWEATGETAFARLGAQLSTWYCGNNVKGADMWDRETGRGFDGIYQDAIDWKAGAESTVAAVRTMTDVERYPDPVCMDEPVATTEDHSYTLYDAEHGAMDSWTSRLDPEGAQAVFSSGRIVKILRPGRLRLDQDLAPGEYRPYVVVQGTIAPEARVVVTVGDQRRTADIAGRSEMYYEMLPLDPVEVATDDSVRVTYEGDQDRNGRVDALVFHPAVAWRTIVGDGGASSAAIARSVVPERRSVSIPVQADDYDSVTVQSLDEEGRVVRGREATVGRGDDPTERTEVSVTVEPFGFTLVHATD